MFGLPRDALREAGRSDPDHVRSRGKARAQTGTRSSGRVVEGARLESVYTVTPYRGFESLLLRHPARPQGWARWWNRERPRTRRFELEASLSSRRGPKRSEGQSLLLRHPFPHLLRGPRGCLPARRKNLEKIVKCLQVVNLRRLPAWVRSFPSQPDPKRARAVTPGADDLALNSSREGAGSPGGSPAPFR